MLLILFRGSVGPNQLQVAESLNRIGTLEEEVHRHSVSGFTYIALFKRQIRIVGNVVVASYDCRLVFRDRSDASLLAFVSRYIPVDTGITPKSAVGFKPEGATPLPEL